MKINWQDIGWVVLLIFVFFPWAIGIVDLVAWMLSGSQVSGIDWLSNRGATMVLWPLLWGGFLAMIFGEDY